MSDLATLGVVVKTAGVKDAERQLEGLAKAGVNAEKGVGRIQPAMASASRAAKIGAEDIARSAKRIGTVLGAATLAFTTGTAVAIKSAIDRADEISKAAQKIGVTTEALSRLEFAAQLADVSIDQLQQGIGFFGRELDKNEPLLNALGVSVRGASGEFLQANDIVRELADVFAALPDGIEKGRLASELFGARVGSDLLPLLNQGSQAIADLEAESDALGNTISTQTGKAAEEFNDTLTRTKIQLQGVFLQISAGILPKLQQFATSLNNPQFREGFATIIEGATTATIKVAELLAGIGNVARFVGEELAARDAGAAGDDIVRLEQQAERLRDRIEKQPDLILFDLGGTKERTAQLEAELARTEAQIAAFYENAAKQGKQAPAIEPPKVEGFDSSAVLAELKAFYEEQAKASERASAARRAESEAARASAQVERELQRIRDEGIGSLAELRDQIGKNAAELAGPAAQAARTYADEMLNLLQIEERLRAAGLLDADAQRELAIARNQAQSGYERQIEAINATESAAESLIADLEFEKRLLGLSNIEREKEIALRYAGADATDEQRDRIRGLIEELGRSNEAINAMDDFRRSFEDSIASILDGSASAQDAIKSFADAFIAQMARIVAQQLAADLFGDTGQKGGGNFGDTISSFLSSFLGGGRAIGGPVSSSKLYEVAEKGEPELLDIRGKQYLIPGADGNVTPMRDGGAASINVAQTIQVTGTIDPRSAYQVQREAQLRLQMAANR